MSNKSDLIKINLLSPEKKDVSSMGEMPAFVEEERESKVHSSAVLAGILIGVAIIAGMYITQQATLKNREQTLKERKARKAELDEVLKELESLEKAKALLDKKVKSIQDLKKQQQRCVKMMDQLSSSLPQWVWLTSLKFSGGRLDLNGKALTNSLIADFINQLKSTNYFVNVQFKDSTRDKAKGSGNQEVFKFSISCVYKNASEPKKAGQNG
jgi:type IV pilus assembly protein PilN